MTIKRFGLLFKKAFERWLAHNAPFMAAALAYYTAFSMAPLLVIAIAIAGLVFGEQAAAGQIVQQLQDLIGKEGAAFIESLIIASARGYSDVVAALIGMGLLVLGATGAFVQLRTALNRVWDVESESASGVLHVVRTHLLSLAMIFAVGFLLLVALIISALLAAVDGILQALVPNSVNILWATHTFLSLIVITVVFATIFKFLPEKEIAWVDTWVGAAITALLFTGGKFLIGIYLGHSTIGSTYGAAGSFAVLLIWIYYSAQIVLYGAEFTQVFATYRSSSPALQENAEQTMPLAS